MRVGRLYSALAMRQAHRLVWSDWVTAISRSASSAPASFRTRGDAALPQTVRISRRSRSAARYSSLVSTRVMSFASDTRFSATDAPTWPAPRMMIFTLFFRLNVRE